MGKIAATEMKQKRKRGRPPKNSLSLSTSKKLVHYDSTHVTDSRSTRWNPNHLNYTLPEFIDGDEDERKDKKVKLVVRLPQSEESNKTCNQKQPEQKNKRHSREDDSASGSGPDSGSESEDQEPYAKKRKINAVDRGSDGASAIQEKQVVTATNNSLHGSLLESGPTVPLADKKSLVFILDRLQKKDTHGVFSEPVDIDELPDYFEVIEQPMDFGTVRKKLDGGAYRNLEELEADVFLICSNAMQYNSPGSVYYRQAQSIQDIAKRDFENLRHAGDNGEPLPKVVRRGRPPGNKNQKKTPSSVDPELLSVATLPIGEDRPPTGSNSYNLRKAPAVNRFRSSDIFVSSYGPRNGVNYSEWLGDWNDEFPAKILRADMKYGKKQLKVDENRRQTYRQFHPMSSANSSSALCNSVDDIKRLVPVGLHEPLAYARSRTRFAANLGPVAWEVALRKIETGSPCNSNKPVTSSTSDLKSRCVPSEGIMVDAVNKGPNELGFQGGDASYLKTPFPPVQQKQPVYQPQRNGFDGPSRYNTSKVVEAALKNDVFPSPLWGTNHFIQDEPKSRESWNNFPPGYQITQQRSSNINTTLLGPPDLNVRIPSGSPSSSVQIGSPRQPELALQL